MCAAAAVSGSPTTRASAAALGATDAATVAFDGLAVPLAGAAAAGEPADGLGSGIGGAAGGSARARCSSQQRPAHPGKSTNPATTRRPSSDVSATASRTRAPWSRTGIAGRRMGGDSQSACHASPTPIRRGFLGVSALLRGDSTLRRTTALRTGHMGVAGRAVRRDLPPGRCYLTSSTPPGPANPPDRASTRVPRGTGKDRMRALALVLVALALVGMFASFAPVAMAHGGGHGGHGHGGYHGGYHGHHHGGWGGWGYGWGL